MWLLALLLAQAPPPAASCVIVKRMGPADQITSHLYSFGFRGKQFQYVEGDFPKGVKFHGRLTDHDIRGIMDKGGKIRILEQGYTADALKEARESCSASAQVKEKEPEKAKPEEKK